eukprot:TRINITY_DN9441_c0_g1_i5.p1 TRINITY_DN9441_c0_g1~~TRINITY_DN9441_c0_g1_i5.p1  ORF type:complete len:750 (+),score=187.95 TRINITY_DN9441_c0_g1_i5:93-2342(+)
MSCPHSDTVTDNARGTKTCRICGEVLESDIIAEELQDYSGAPVKASGMGWARAGRSFQKTQATGESSYSKMERVRSEMVVVATEMNLQDYIDGALRIYQMASNTGKVMTGRQYHTMCCACLYIVCRVHRHPIEIYDFQEHLQVSPFSVGKIVETICKVLNIKAAGIGTAGNLAKYIRALGIKNDDYVQRIQDTAQKLIDQMDKAFISEGRQPAGIRAAALYLAIRFNGFSRVQLEHVTKIVGAGDGQTLNRLQEYEKLKGTSDPSAVLPDALVKQQHYDKLISKYIAHKTRVRADGTAEDLPSDQANADLYTKKQKDRVSRLARQKKLRKKKQLSPAQLAKQAKLLAIEKQKKLIEKKTKNRQRQKNKAKIKRKRKEYKKKGNLDEFNSDDVSKASSCEKVKLKKKAMTKIKEEAKQETLKKFEEAFDSDGFASEHSEKSADISFGGSTDDDNELTLFKWYHKDLEKQKLEKELLEKKEEEANNPTPNDMKPEGEDIELTMDDFNFSENGSVKNFGDSNSCKGTPRLDPSAPYDSGFESDATVKSRQSRGGVIANIEDNPGLFSEVVGGAEKALFDLGITFNEEEYEDEQKIDETINIPTTVTIKEDIKNFTSFSDVSDEELREVVITDEDEVEQRLQMWKSHYQHHLQQVETRTRENEERKLNAKKRVKREPQSSLLAPGHMEFDDTEYAIEAGLQIRGATQGVNFNRIGTLLDNLDSAVKKKSGDDHLHSLLAESPEGGFDYEEDWN